MFRLAAYLVAAVLAAPAAAADRLVVQLAGGWGPEDAGFAVAEADGLYAAEGLDVTFRPGLALDPLARGEVELAVAHMAPALLARAEGADLVNVAQIVRKPTLAIVCAAGSGVDAPADLRGQSFAPPPPGQEPALDLALALFGVLEPRLAADAPCRLGRNFAPPPAEAAVFPLAEMGLPLLEEGVWALGFSLRREEFRARVVRFLRASLDGWTRFARDPEGALAKLDAGRRARFLPAAPGVAAALGSAPLGRMDEAAFLTTARLLMLGWIEPSLEAPPEDAWRDDLRAAAAGRPASAGPARARDR